MCDNGRVLVNGQAVKPARVVKPGDVITLKFSTHTVSLEVLYPLDVQSGKTPSDVLYRLLSETRLPKEKELWSEDPSSS